jgi:hypothetical protein
MGKVDYRKLWKEYHGIDIPKDEQGRSYEIHHVDGNRSNNSIENLVCVSIEEHKRIHLEQGDIGSANLIADRFDKVYERGWQHSKETKRKMSEAHKGINTWSKGRPNPQKIVECPYCKKIGGQSGMVKYHFDNCLQKPGNEALTRKISEEIKAKYRKPKSKITIPQPVVCEYCGKKGGPRAMKRWHFDNCKKKSQI